MPSRVQVELTPTEHDYDENLDHHTSTPPQHKRMAEDARANTNAAAVVEVAQDPDTDPIADADDGLLFSCRCESARSVATLLSCLRNVSLPSGAGGGPSLATMQDATSSLLTAPSSQRRMTQGGGGAGNGNGSGLRGSKTQYATVFCSERGLIFQVYGIGKQSRATVEMQVGLFSDYYVAEQRIILDDDDSNGGDGGHEEIIRGGEFGINLTTVLGCLTVLGTASLDRTTLCLSYDTSSAIFKIELLEDSPGSVVNGGVIISNCAIPGQSVSDDALILEEDEYGHETGLDAAFRAHPIVARAKVKSDFLSAAVEELTNCAGAVTATIGISKVGLELATFGHSTECHVVVPYAGNHPDIFVSLEGVAAGPGPGGDRRDNKTHMHARSYPLHSVLSAMRGLEIANETCISMNKIGMVAIQHQVIDSKIGNGDPNYVDFIMGCLQDDDEEEDETDEEEYVQDNVGNNRIAPALTPNRNTSRNGLHERERHEDLSQFSAQSNGVEFTPSETVGVPEQNGNGNGNASQDDHGVHTQQRSQSSSRHRIDLQNGNKNHNDKDNKNKSYDSDGDEETEDENEETQGSSSPPLLFGAVATIGTRRRERYNTSNKRRRAAAMAMTDHSYSQVDSSQGDNDGDDDDDDSEFEETLDVTMNAAAMNRSRTRRQQLGESSPQLMYGDTHLEGASDDE